MDIEMDEEIVYDNVASEIDITADELQQQSANLNSQLDQLPKNASVVSISPRSATSPNKTKQIITFTNTNQAVGSNQPKNVMTVNSMPITPTTTRIVTTPVSSPNSENNSANNSSNNAKITINIPASSGLQANQVITKFLVTGSGQQLLITSPIKSGSQQQQQMNQNSQQQSEYMAILPMSPNRAPKCSGAQGTATLKPKPVAIAPSTSADVKPQFQIIRLVSSNTNQASTSSQVTTTANSSLRPLTSNFVVANAAQSGATGGQKLLIPASAIKGVNLNSTQFITTSGGATPVLMYTNAQIVPTNSSTPIVSNATGSSKIVLTSTGTPVAGGISSSTLHRTNYVPILPNPSSNAVLSNSTPLAGSHALNISSQISSTQKLIMPNGTKLANDELVNVSTSSALSASRQRKPCSCTRSQCLKMYCDCFTNGEFCANCNCINCYNNLEHEEERQKAIKQCLDRNPTAFRPKIGKGRVSSTDGVLERRHTKGCNCRRSGCLKNYCECYEAKILCSDLCKCITCKNFEDSYERKTLMHMADSAEVRSAAHQSMLCGKDGTSTIWGGDFRPKLPVNAAASDRLLPVNFITNDVLEATAQCLLTQAENGKKSQLSDEDIEKSIIEEFGRCLIQIIDITNKAKR